MSNVVSFANSIPFNYNATLEKLLALSVYRDLSDAYSVTVTNLQTDIDNRTVTMTADVNDESQQMTIDNDTLYEVTNLTVTELHILFEILNQ